MRFFLLLILYIAAQISLYAQDIPEKVYTLDQCIAFALEHNLDLESSSLQQRTADIGFRQSRNALLPNLNGNYNIGETSGRSIDPFTNTYSNEKLTFSNAGLSLDAVVFNGFRLINRWKQQKYNLEAAELETEEARQNLILNVTLAYLQVLNAKDLYALAEARQESTREQLVRLRALYEEEIGNPAEYRDFQGLEANNKAGLLQAANALDDARLRLMQWMNTDMPVAVSPLTSSLELLQYNLTDEEILADAMTRFPGIRANERRLDAAEKGKAVARSLYIPQVSVFANWNTNYSSAARIFNEHGSSIVETGDFVTINGASFPVQTEQSNFIAEEIDYANQLENNLNTAIGVAVNIPLFNGFRARNAVALEKIRIEEAEVALERTRLELRIAIKQAYRDMKTAAARVAVLEEQVAAYEESYRINMIRFNNGVDNSVDYIISKNNLDSSRINLANARYEYQLWIRILEYYRGNIGL